MHDELLSLRNLGKTSVQWLHASGIHTAADLRRLGAVSSYRAVKARGFGASKVLLYAIEGALRDVPLAATAGPAEGRTESEPGQRTRQLELAHNLCAA